MGTFQAGALSWPCLSAARLPARTTTRSHRERATARGADNGNGRADCPTQPVAAERLGLGLHHANRNGGGAPVRSQTP